MCMGEYATMLMIGCWSWVSQRGPSSSLLLFRALSNSSSFVHLIPHTIPLLFSELYCIFFSIFVFFNECLYFLLKQRAASYELLLHSLEQEIACRYDEHFVHLKPSCICTHRCKCYTIGQIMQANLNTSKAAWAVSKLCRAELKRKWGRSRSWELLSVTFTC